MLRRSAALLGGGQLDRAQIPQDDDVVRDGGQRHIELVGKPVGRRAAPEEGLEDLGPHGVGDRPDSFRPGDLAHMDSIGLRCRLLDCAAAPRFPGSGGGILGDDVAGATWSWCAGRSTPGTRGESRPLLEFYPEDVVWFPFPDSPESANGFRGHDGIREVMAGWSDSFDEYTVATNEIRDCGDKVVWLGEISGRIRGSRRAGPPADGKRRLGLPRRQDRQGPLLSLLGRGP